MRTVGRPIISVPITEGIKEAFLDALAEGHSINAAAKIVGVSRVHWNRLAMMDDGFQADQDEALAEGRKSRADLAQDALVRNATQGKRNAHYERNEDGEMILTKVVYQQDTVAAIVLAKAHDPAYRDAGAAAPTTQLTLNLGQAGAAPQMLAAVIASNALDGLQQAVLSTPRNMIDIEAKEVGVPVGTTDSNERAP